MLIKGVARHQTVSPCDTANLGATPCRGPALMWRACKALRPRKSGDNDGTEGRTRVTPDIEDPRPHPFTSLPEYQASRTRVTSATSSPNESLQEREGTVTPSCAEPPWSQQSLLWGRDAQHRFQPLRTADPRPQPLCKPAERPPRGAGKQACMEVPCLLEAGNVH